jgi:O-acetyl-ADP-ribose deacetylase (regulator of RNase III)
MKYVKGNLLDMAENGDFHVIVHGCNIHHTFGSGIAKQIRERYPQAYEVDLLSNLSDPRKLGMYTAAEIYVRDAEGDAISTFVIINLYTQATFGKTGVHVDYDAIARGFYALDLALKNSYGANHELRIGIPKIGAGLGGGDWDKIVSIIEENCKLDITCVEYDG